MRSTQRGRPEDAASQRVGASGESPGLVGPRRGSGHDLSLENMDRRTAMGWGNERLPSVVNLLELVEHRQRSREEMMDDRKCGRDGGSDGLARTALDNERALRGWHKQ